MSHQVRIGRSTADFTRPLGPPHSSSKGVVDTLDLGRSTTLTARLWSSQVLPRNLVDPDVRSTVGTQGTESRTRYLWSREDPRSATESTNSVVVLGVARSR